MNSKLEKELLVILPDGNSWTCPKTMFLSKKLILFIHAFSR